MKDDSSVEKLVTAHTHDGVMEITISRPAKMNALTFAMLRDLKDLCDAAAIDGDVRVVLLRGAGDNFCAGDDLGGMGDFPAGLTGPEKYHRVGFLTAVRAVRELGKPVISGIQGYCLGAGFDLALASDFRIVTKDAVLGTRYIRIGLASGGYLLPRLVGTTRAADMLFGGRDIDGETAERWGIATELVERDGLDAACNARARHLASMPTAAIAILKRQMYAASETSLDAAIHTMCLGSAIAHEFEDYREAKAAWAERRAPQFVGR